VKERRGRRRRRCKRERPRGKEKESRRLALTQMKAPVWVGLLGCRVVQRRMWKWRMCSKGLPQVGCWEKGEVGASGYAGSSWVSASIKAMLNPKSFVQATAALCLKVQKKKFSSTFHKIVR
jgi:hypothetical protein